MVNSKQDLNKTTYESLASVDTFDAADPKQTEKYIFDKYFKPPGIILDLGCGAGRTTYALAERGFIVEAIDYSEAMIERAKKKHANLSADIHFKVMNAKHLEYGDNYFNYVFFSFNGIDYLSAEPERRQALLEIYRVLKPGGIFAFSSHNSLFIPNNMRRILNFFKTALYGKISPYRLEFLKFGRLLTHHISVKNQIAELKAIGFEFLKVVSKYSENEKKISRIDPYPSYVCRKNY